MNKQKILCVLLAIVLLSGISISSYATNQIQTNEILNNENNNQITGNNIDDLNHQREDMQENLDKLANQLEYVQTELSAALIEVQQLDDKIRQYEQENSNLASRLQSLETSVEEAKQNLEIVTQDYNEKQALLRDRLVALYKAGDISYLDVLLSANSLSDFLSIYYAMIEIAEHDNQLIEKVDEELKTIDQTKRKLENETAEIRILKAKAEQFEVILTNTKTLKQGYIEKLSQEEQKANQELQNYKNELAQIEAKIHEYSSYEGEVDIQFTGGIMIWPVAISGTKITSGYGIREHPIQGVIKFHQGIDIGNTGYGAPAVAAADGVVTYAGWLGSYGNCVMIYHGDGITTLYGHGQAVVAQRGQQVKQGDIVLETGSTGNSTGPHLHFEVRINGKNTNPLNYVKEP